MNPLVDLGSLQVAKAMGSPEKPYIIMFHGYGANAYDLFSLSQEVGTNLKWNWIFPQGPLALDFGYFEGRAWFPIEIESLDRAINENKVDGWLERNPKGLQSARGMALKMLTALNIPEHRLVLGGFSQGAMLAIDVALHLPKPPAAVVALSGAPVNRTEWSKKEKPFKIPFFQSHGEQDQVLPYLMGQTLETVLQDFGWDGMLYSFRGGHEIPRPVLKELERFLIARDKEISRVAP